MKQKKDNDSRQVVEPTLAEQGLAEIEIYARKLGQNIFTNDEANNLCTLIMQEYFEDSTMGEEHCLKKAGALIAYQIGRKINLEI